ncbi:MAG: Crp/Fnr family transcriptional regulator [Bifidobacteriaceae bacterium]|jgi:CRP-like cAMP-binding protein|nr:Crp/Fnr family transcriptional regulator [Bifidobacteriaceae bacterium]
MNPRQGSTDNSNTIPASGLFAGIDGDQAQRLRDLMAVQRLARGKVLFREGDEGDRLYLIQSGMIKLGRTSPDGRESLLAVLGRGEFIGELTLFDPGPRTATATAVTESELLELSHDAIGEWLDQNPAASKHLLQELAHRLRRTNEAVTDLVFADVPGRVAKALLDLADRFGEDAADGVHVTHGLTQEELAHLVGASRETVNKALAEFAARNWIRLEGRSVHLLDIERLTRRAA